MSVVCSEELLARGLFICFAIHCLFFWRLCLTSSVFWVQSGPRPQSHQAVYDMITINHSLWSNTEKHFLHHGWNAVVETKGCWAVPRLPSDCTSLWCSILSITRLTLSAVFFSSPCRQMKGKTYHFDAVYWVFAKITLWWILRERKKKSCRGGFKSSINGRQIFDKPPKPSVLG